MLSKRKMLIRQDEIIMHLPQVEVRARAHVSILYLDRLYDPILAIKNIDKIGIRNGLSNLNSDIKRKNSINKKPW
jgi:hypothetical protein